MQLYYTYIVTNPNKTTFYTGQTNNLHRRIVEHYNNRGKFETFAGRYYCYYILYYEIFSSRKEAIQRENEIKALNHNDKMELVIAFNPNMFFLNKELLGVDWRNIDFDNDYSEVSND